MIKKEEAYEKAKDYIIAYLGNRLGPGMVFFNAKDRVWTVSIVHYSEQGETVVGEICFDENGEMVYVPTPARLEKLIENSLAGKIVRV